MSCNRRVEKNGVLNQSAQEESLRLKHKGKNPMGGVSISASYPYRPGEPDCSYYLRTGSCGYGSNCRFNHPVYDAQGGQYREEHPERIRQPNCVYFLKTGTCKYGSTCKYRHPKDMNGSGLVRSNILGLPVSQQGKKACTFYMRTGSCRFGVACKFHHHQSASPGACLTANGPVGSASMPPSGEPRAPYVSGRRLQLDQIEEDQSEFRGWDELIPEALGLIFSDLSLEELLTVIPCVCKSWRNVVTGPYCWQEIDIEQWSKLWYPHHVDRMLRMLIKRSSGSLRKLCASGLQNDSTFSFITKNASSLQALRLPGSEMRDSVVEQTAKRLSTITLLDLSYCNNIGSRALKSIGKHCKLLVTLCRNVEEYMLVDEPRDAEANAIAATMPGLKHLEMADHEISTGGVLNILSGCPQLEFLDISGCCDVELDNGFLKEKFPKLKVVGPFVMEEFREWDEGVDFNTDSDFDPWDPDYLDYDDYTDPFHPDHHQNDDDYELFFSEFFDGIIEDARMYGRMFG